MWTIYAVARLHASLTHSQRPRSVSCSGTSSDGALTSQAGGNNCPRRSGSRVGSQGGVVHLLVDDGRSVCSAIAHPVGESRDSVGVLALRRRVGRGRETSPCRGGRGCLDVG